MTGPTLTEAEGAAIRKSLREWFAESHMRQTVETIVAARVAEAQAKAVELSALLAKYAHKFWPKVKVGTTTECWPWTGSVVNAERPYGSFATPAGHVAHRYAWSVANGRLPGDGLVIRHKCDNPRCCNPAHLEEGTQRQNVGDMRDRGRAFWSEDQCSNGHPRTPENVRLTADGSRRCIPCDKVYRERPRDRSLYICRECGRVLMIHSLQRHMTRIHNTPTTTPEIRAGFARAAALRPGEGSDRG